MSTGTMRAAGFIGRWQFERQWRAGAALLTAAQAILLAVAVAGITVTAVFALANVALRAMIPPLWQRGALANVSFEMHR